MPHPSSPLRIIVPTKDRATTIRTPKALAFVGSPVTVLVHDEEQKGQYVRGGRVDPRSVVVTGVPGDTFGLTRQREWALENLVEQDEWIVFADDNIREVRMVPEPHWQHDKLLVTEQSHTWREVFSSLAGPQDWIRFTFEAVARAEAEQARLVGCATTENPFFRGNKYRTVGYVSGKLMLWRNDPSFEFDHTISMEDFRNTAEHLLRYGAVLVNNYVWPQAGHYEPGGMGTKLERVPIRELDVIHLQEKYPGLFRPKERDGKSLDVDLGVRFTSREQVDQWRTEMAGVQA